MKRLQLHFNLLMMAYCLAACSLTGFSAILLDGKGLSSTQIGLCTGGAGLLSIPLSALFSKAMIHWPKISLQQWLFMIMTACGLLYMSLAFFALPAWLLMVCFTLADALIVAYYPIAVTLVMNFVEKDPSLNFGLARGSGSIFYAFSSVLLSRILQYANSAWLFAFFLLAGLILILALWNVKASYPAKAKSAAARKKDTFSSVIKGYPLFFTILVGFTFILTALNGVSTFLVKLINNLGGDTSYVGISMFCMAASELPAMAYAPRLLKKTGPLPLLAAAALFYVLRILLPVWASQLWILTIGQLMQGFSYGILMAVIAYYITATMPAGQAAIGQTLFNMMTSGAAGTLGNFCAGAVLDVWGLGGLRWMATLLTAAGVIIVVVPIALTLAHQRRSAA